MTRGPVRRFAVGRVRISAVTMADSLNLVDARIRARHSAYMCVSNTATIAVSHRDQEFCRILNESFLTLPDGMPLVWCARLAGVPGVERVTGPDLLLRVLEISEEKGYSHYFYGDTNETLTRMAQVISRRYPGAEVKGMHSPPFRPLTAEEIEETVDTINRLKPTFVWVGLGHPKQERWMARAIERIDSAILIGVGAAFRFLIGEYDHPPRIFQKCALEGIYWRLLRHPVAEGRWLCRQIPFVAFLLLRSLADRFSRRNPKGDATGWGRTGWYE